MGLREHRLRYIDTAFFDYLMQISSYRCWLCQFLPQSSCVNSALQLNPKKALALNIHIFIFNNQIEVFLYKFI